MRRDTHSTCLLSNAMNIPPRRSLQMPNFVPLSGAKFITHSMGFKLTENAEEGVESLFKAAREGYVESSVQLARKVVLRMLEGIEGEEKLREVFDASVEDFVVYIKLIMRGEGGKEIEKLLRKLIKN